MRPKVSVLIPCYNVEKYLHECIDSVVNQTLREIQIICINDGSTDSTLSILEEYARRDSRIQIISKSNSGYGDSMNCGLEVAVGEYVGIVESDDFAELDMFERLYTAAVKYNLDVCKAGFYHYITTAKKHDIPNLLAVKRAGTKVFCPTTDFRKPEKMANFFQAMPSIWSAVYRRDFIRENNIRFNPTPGASYQDVDFCLKVWCKAKRVQFLNCCLLHYRTDNSQSSVHNTGKVYCICDEYSEIFHYLEENPVECAQVKPAIIRTKYDHYLWNYERLSEPVQKEFLHCFYREFKQHESEGLLQREYFSWYDWNHLQMLLLDPDRYHDIQSRKLAGETAEDFYDAYPEHRPIKGKLAYYLAENLSGALHYLNDAGISALMSVLVNKIKKRMKSCNKQKGDSILK